jgi:RNA exonuclease 1
MGNGQVIHCCRLENDFKYLRFFPGRVIDTAVLYPSPKGLPYRHSLKFLSQKILGKAIQEDLSGHDSLEDAISCLELVKKYLHK